MSMSPDQMIAVIQAHREGKPIQGRTKEGFACASDTRPWVDLDVPGWDFYRNDYRVKPDESAEPEPKRTRIDEMIAVLEAANAGKIIECRSRDSREEWGDKSNLVHWNFERWDYRVKPKPREWFIALYAEQGLCGQVFDSEKEAVRHGRITKTLVRVREVLE